MDINAMFEAQKNSTTSTTDLRSRGIALSTNDVASINLEELRIIGAYEDRKPTGKPDLDEFGNPKVAVTLRFTLKSGVEQVITAASEYMDVKQFEQLHGNIGKAVEVEDLYILPYMAKGGVRKDGSEYGQQSFELRFKSIKLKSFEPAK